MKDRCLFLQNLKAPSTRPEGSTEAAFWPVDLVDWMHLGERHSPSCSAPLRKSIVGFRLTRQDTLAELSHRAVNALRHRVSRSARLTTRRAEGLAVRAQLAALAAEQLWERAGRGCQPRKAMDAEALQASPTPRRA